jgi:hypothetical protein
VHCLRIKLGTSWILVENVAASSNLVWLHSANHLTLPAGRCCASHNLPNILGEEILHNLKNVETLYVKVLTAMRSLRARLPPETAQNAITETHMQNMFNNFKIVSCFVSIMTVDMFKI